MRSTSSYIIRHAARAAGVLVLLLLWLPSRAQFPSDVKYGLRLGADLSRIPLHFLNPYRTDVAFQGDLRIDSNLYAAAEAGWNKTELDNKDVFSYDANGVYLKAGVDYNILKRKQPWENNIIYVGFRYGIARMRRTVPGYVISDPYWGNTEGHFDTKTLLPQWAEVVLGLKAEVANNLFLGWSLHTRVLTTPHIDKLVRPYLIPGFGKATKNAVFDVSYTISYRIPLWSPRPRIPQEKKPAEAAPAPANPDGAPPPAQDSTPAPPDASGSHGAP